jgi:glutamate-5-semialdehyde dehydrogenase
MSEYVENLTKAAKAAAYKVAAMDTGLKTKVLRAMAGGLLKNKAFILKANKKDIDTAIKNNQAESYIDRLTLNEKRLEEMSDSLKAIATFKDPVGRIISSWMRPNGLKIMKMRSPIGVVLIVYEARPNVTSDCVGLLLKSSNVGILRGGKDSVNSNLAVAKVLQDAARKSGIKFPIFFMVENPGYEIVDELLRQHESIDLVIPRGGEALIKKVVESSTIPVIKHYKGVCHIFVDKTADLKQALKVCVNAKVQRPGVCNAVEKILVHKVIAKKFLPDLKKVFDKNKVEIRGDKATCSIIDVKAANEADWYAEYLDLIVTVGVINDVEAAIAHINKHSSHHTDSILTRDKANADKFTRGVDSACCFVNISTRFSDGGQFGLGAEIGISTDKLHARGPMGVEDLTTYKYVVSGTGQVRE